MAARPLGPTPFAMAFGTLICACFGIDRSCVAAEANLPSPVHVAAAATEGDPSRPSRRNLRSEEKLELEWLLAQSAQSTASGETIIAIFPASATPTVELDVAKDHKLEFVRRLEVGSWDRRIVVYRVTDGRTAEAVATLKGDLRVESAQPNVHYALPPQAPAPAAVSDVKRPGDRPTIRGKRHVSEADAKIIPPGRSSGPAERSGVAGDTEAVRSGRRGGLVTRDHTALRWPTADEPFVNIGGRNR
jgi:hypothetical protein